MAVLDLPKLLTPDEAAKLLGTTVGTLSVWRCTRRHNLPFIRVGRLVRYDREDLRAWIVERRQGGTDE
jgi:excisionase family DNA binding protein